MKTHKSDKLGNVTVPEGLVTRNIAGHEISLEPGIRYRASRPIGRATFPVAIRRVSDEPVGPDVVINGLTYDEANELINAFNNGKTSFEGRVW